ncbi:MAG: glycosyltransferase [Bdellovibrionales bacterium]|nr:glycosyltransferase [Bdellovibrionales bacterium]
MYAAIIVSYLYAIWNLLRWLDVVREAKAFEGQSLRLNHNSLSFEQVDAPLVSVVVPACNEEQNILSTLQSLESQTYSNIEVVAVNDRSTDSSGQIMKAFCETHPRFQYLEINHLPEGWLGKNNALNSGAKLAAGELLLFTDGDIIFSPNAIEHSLRILNGSQLDHLVVAPNFKSSDAILSSMQCFFSLMVLTLFRPSGFGKLKNSYIGAGAFNLLSSKIYKSFGGHEQLRLEVVDDIMLGKLVVRHGGKQALLDGSDMISVAWYANWREMILGLQKNAFAGLRYSWLSVLRITIETFGLNILPYYFLTTFDGLPFYILLTGVALMHTTLAVAAHKMGYSPALTILTPISALLLWFAQLRSAVITHLDKGITWRGTHYPLKALKENKV